MFGVRFKPASNLADWQSLIQMTDKSTGELIDLSGGATPITWALRARLIGKAKPGYAQIAIDNAGLGGITLQGVGVMQIYVPASVMQTLQTGSYQVYLIATNGTMTRQIYIGLLPVMGDPIYVAPDYGFGYRYG
jgi:hypothetical protein